MDSCEECEQDRLGAINIPLKGGGTRLDECHSFGPGAELIIDRSRQTPLSDSRVVHYDTHTKSYVMFTGERIRFNTLDGVTVFQETSPWDTQIRQDPPVNFHFIAQPAVTPGDLKSLRLNASVLQEAGIIEKSGRLYFLADELPLPPLRGKAGMGGSIQKLLNLFKGVRGPLLYPRTESTQSSFVRNLSVFTPSGVAYHVKEISATSGVWISPADIRIGLRFALNGDELLLSLSAQNLSTRTFRVSLISFFLPLLTRDFTFNAESPWLHEGKAIPGRGYFIKTGETGLSCGIRYCHPKNAEHWDNTSTLKYHGGMDRDASFPAAVQRGAACERDLQAGFVAPACANTQDRMVLGPNQSGNIHFAVQVFKRDSETHRYLERNLTPTEIEHKAAQSEKNAEKLIFGSSLKTPSADFSCFYTWIKQQISGCARIQSRFRLFWNYLLGIRDKAQAALAAIDFDPALGRTLILELSGQQFEDGRFPRQYSLENTYDLRYFMDSGLWIPTMLIPHYLKCTGDFNILKEKAGYKILKNWDPVKRAGQVDDSPKTGTVLDHLIENVDHVIANRDPTTGLINIRDGDWNDAIGLIQNSTMVLEQLYLALTEMVEMEKHLPGNIRHSAAGRRLTKKIPAYANLMDDLRRTFVRHSIQKSPAGELRIIHGYTKEGRTVGGFWDSDRVVTEADFKKNFSRKVDRKYLEAFRNSHGEILYKLHRRWVGRSCQKLRDMPREIRDIFLVDRISSTPLSFALLSGILRHGTPHPSSPPRGEEVTLNTLTAIEEAVARDAARLDCPYGFKTFNQPFNTYSRDLLIGRIGNLDGAENASPYVHAGMFLCQGLYRIGQTALANEFIDKTIPINREVHARQNRGINYMPNSWGIGRNNDGAAMNDFHTNAASIFSRIVVEEIIGLKATYSGIEIQPVEIPPALMGRGDLVEYTAVLRGRPVKIVHRWTSAVKSRQIRIGQKLLRTTIPVPRRIPSSFLPWSDLKTSSVNEIYVFDPLRVTIQASASFPRKRESSLPRECSGCPPSRA